MNSLSDIYKKWKTQYCAGSPIPLYFRTEASQHFSFVFNSKDKNYNSCKYQEQFIYRVIATPHEGKLISFDNLYYSFSADIQGVKNFAIHDKNIRNDLFLIIAKPVMALDFNTLGNILFENFNQSKFYSENEVVSKLKKSTIFAIYYLQEADDLDNYLQTGILINVKDTELDIKNILVKYNLPIEWLK